MLLPMTKGIPPPSIHVPKHNHRMLAPGRHNRQIPSQSRRLVKPLGPQTINLHMPHRAFSSIPHILSSLPIFFISRLAPWPSLLQVFGIPFSYRNFTAPMPSPRSGSESPTRKGSAWEALWRFKESPRRRPMPCADEFVLKDGRFVHFYLRGFPCGLQAELQNRAYPMPAVSRQEWDL